MGKHCSAHPVHPLQKTSENASSGNNFIKDPLWPALIIIIKGGRETNLLANREYQALPEFFAVTYTLHEGNKRIDALPFDLETKWICPLTLIIIVRSIFLFPVSALEKKRSGITSCSTPTTAASAHWGCDTRADSTSAVPIRCPLRKSKFGRPFDEF